MIPTRQFESYFNQWPYLRVTDRWYVKHILWWIFFWIIRFVNNLIFSILSVLVQAFYIFFALNTVLLYTTSTRFCFNWSHRFWQFNKVTRDHHSIYRLLLLYYLIESGIFSFKNCISLLEINHNITLKRSQHIHIKDLSFLRSHHLNIWFVSLMIQLHITERITTVISYFPIKIYI